MTKNKEKLVVIDSNAIIHRAFHALPPLTTKDGTLTNVVYGFALTLLSVLEKIKPDYIAATFDLKGPTFRHRKFKDYKATRKKAPDELYQQIPLVKDLVRAFNIPIFELKGYEADDLIGTIVKNPEINGNLEKVIVTGDMDALQLVDENVKVFTLRRGITDTVIYDQKKVKERYQLRPDQLIDYKALRGDPSDNIPGIKGVGEKTATDLLIKYKNLDGIYKNIEDISSPAIKKKISEGKDDAFMSHDLARIRTDVPVKFKLEDCRTIDYDKQIVVDFLRGMEFFSLVKRVSGKTEEEKASLAKTIGDRKIEIISRKEEVGGIVSDIKKKKKVALYFSEEAEEDSSGFGISLGKTDYFVPFDFFSLFDDVFRNEKIVKIGYDFKNIFKQLFHQFGDWKEVDSTNNFFDIQIASYLLKSGTRPELEKLIFEELGAELKNKVVKKGQMNLLVDNSEMKQKETAEKAFWTGQLFDRYEKEIKNLKKVFDDLETPLIKILARMEVAGVKVDKEILNNFSELITGRLNELEKKIFKLTENEFNINSPSQLAEVLYEKLKISTAGIKRGKTGFSTNAEQLKKLFEVHPVIPLIEEYRGLFKLKTTYADALPGLVKEDGRIHTSFNQSVVATGRLSSSKPNLQNIPKKGDLGKTIREAFVAEKGNILVSADYSQIDLRVAAHLSGDEKMVKIFEEGKDIHRATASWVNNIPEEKITNRQRSEAKSLNFGVLYGMGIYGFMRDSGVSQKRAGFFIEQYMEKFSGLKKYLDKTKEFAAKKGYVETEMGRRRYIVNINSQNFQVRQASERMAINLPVQGLAADIMKLSMIEAENLISEKYSDKVRTILQIHDELIFEVDSGVADKFMVDIKKCMEGVYELKVPLVVDVGKGENWREL
jgi:DNA polymerase I